MTADLEADLLDALGTRRAGCQLHVTDASGATSSISAGRDSLGRPMEPSTLCNLFCLTKPIFGVFCLRLAEAAGVAIDDELTLRPALGPELRTTLGHLLSHRTGLSHPTAAEWRMTPRAMRPEVRSRFATTGSSTYSEIANGLLLEEWCRGVLHPASLRAAMDEWLEELGIADHIICFPEAMNTAPRNLATHVAIDATGDAVPLLSELRPEHIAETRPAFGALGSARGIGTFLDLLGRHLSGSNDPDPRFPTRSAMDTGLAFRREGPIQDDLLGYPVQFAAGFQLTQPGLPGLERLEPSCIGHTAGMSVAFAFVHPGTGASCTLISNRLVTGREDMARRRRAAVEVLAAHSIADTLWD